MTTADNVLVEALKQESAADAVPLPGPVVLEREEATWYRLVTTLASCYAYVRLHTAPEPCRFEIAPDGQVQCYLGEIVQWEVTLPVAAYRQFPFVVRLWRRGALAHCLQVDSIRLSNTRRLPSGHRSVAVLPVVPVDRRTETLARRPALWDPQPTKV